MSSKRKAKPGKRKADKLALTPATPSTSTPSADNEDDQQLITLQNFGSGQFTREDALTFLTAVQQLSAQQAAALWNATVQTQQEDETPESDTFGALTTEALDPPTLSPATSPTALSAPTATTAMALDAAALVDRFLYFTRFVEKSLNAKLSPRAPSALVLIAIAQGDWSHPAHDPRTEPGIMACFVASVKTVGPVAPIVSMLYNVAMRELDSPEANKLKASLPGNIAAKTHERFIHGVTNLRNFIQTVQHKILPRYFNNANARQPILTNKLNN